MRVFGVLLLCATAWGASVRLPVAFEPNRGQTAGADFLARGNGYTMSVRAGRAELSLRGARVTTVLSGARAHAAAVAEEPLPGVVHYLKGSDASQWITDIPTYQRVRYRGVYSGIDVVYYGNEGRLEYDFVVAPGADPRQIRMRYDGARSLDIDDAGDLVIGAGKGTIRHHRPEIYQDVDGERRVVVGGYELKAGTVRFRLGSYDKTRPLVIDPALTWATYTGVLSTGGPSVYGEGVESVALDAAGNIYLAGSAFGPSGYGDIFFTKLNNSGTAAAFSVLFGGSYDNECHAMAVDAAGNIYLAGETNSPDFPAYTTLGQGVNGDAFVSKIDSSGKSLVYSYFLGGTGQDAAYGIALDASNNAYVVGATVSTDFPISRGVAQTARAGGVDAFVTKFDSNGNGIYSTFLGGSGDDYGYGIAADAAGNVYLTGNTTSTNFPATSGAFQAKAGGVSDVFVAKLSTAGTMVFATYLGGSGNDFGYSIAIDSSGASYITGETASSDFPLVNPYQKTFGGGAGDIFLAKVSGDGSSLVYSTYVGGTGEDLAYSVAVDTAGAAYLTGSTSSTDFPLVDAFQTKNQGAANALVAGFDASGAALFSSYLGGSGGDYGNAVAINCATGLVVAGGTGSADFPVTAGALATTYSGGGDGFIARMGVGGTPSISSVVNAASLGSGPVAPGSLIALLGAGFSADSKVAINGSNVPIISTSPGQMVVQLPNEIGVGAGTAVATVTSSCGTSPAITFAVAQAAPYVQQTASGDAVAFNPDGTANSAGNPAKAGTTLTVILTGIGPVDNAVATGTPAPATPASKATLPASATVGGFDSTVQFLGLAPGTVGWAQAQLVIPAVSTGPYPVMITVGGVASNGPTVYVQ